MNDGGTNSKMSTKQTKAQPNKKAAENVENICAMKRLLNVNGLFTTFPAISSRVVSRKSLRLSTHRASDIRGRTG